MEIVFIVEFYFNEIYLLYLIWFFFIKINLYTISEGIVSFMQKLIKQTGEELRMSFPVLSLGTAWIVKWRERRSVRET